MTNKENHLKDTIINLLEKHAHMEAYMQLEIYLGKWPDSVWGKHQKALLLYHRGQYQQALDLANDLLVANPKNQKIRILCITLNYELNPEDNNIVELEKIIDETVDNVDALRNFGSGIWKTDRSKGYKALLKALSLDPSDYASLNNLTMLFADENEYTHAQAFGALSLYRKDQVGKDTFALYQDQFNLTLNAPDQNQGTRNVVSMCLWGSDATYLEGAIRCASEMCIYYPGWDLQITYDETVPDDALDRLKSEGAIMVMATPEQKRLFGGLWRFDISLDPTVKRFVCRDADSRFSERETESVHGWIESGKSFHVIRDDIWHCELILAGMWGGIGGVLPDIRPVALYLYGDSIRKWDDQDFLRDIVWPMIIDDCLIHDDNYPLFGAFPHETPRAIDVDEHIGYGYRINTSLKHMNLSFTGDAKLKEASFPNGWHKCLKEEVMSQLRSMSFEQSKIENIIEQINNAAIAQGIEFDEGHQFEAYRDERLR